MFFGQLKKNVSPDARNHFIDAWCDWLTPEKLVQRWNFTTTYGQAWCREKTNTSILSVIQSNQNTKYMMISKIIQEVPRWNMEENLPFIVIEPIKEALPQRQKTGSVV
ncbi:hypothetical protein CEXT_3751 [Caerostris extrusa]|uniref:Uncharacterized protein n=1 Tax=Caerostris extrusa TaxID=172846 RepID=A0AAV4QF91_CAEEX|nr:hypothetical protein CEXT_3751 [Caerostris extrusa]